MHKRSNQTDKNHTVNFHFYPTKCVTHGHARTHRLTNTQKTKPTETLYALRSTLLK